MEEKVYRGSAPGRLDFMGGVADYSGSLVLQIPIAAMVSAGPEQGIYGGRASGGGSGGTVAVLLEREAVPLLEELKEKVGLKDRGELPLIRSGK